VGRWGGQLKKRVQDSKDVSAGPRNEQPVAPLVPVAHSVPNPVCISDHGSWTVSRHISIPVKKSLGHFQPEDVAQVYAVMGRLQQDGFPIAALCEALQVHRSQYYAWQRGRTSQRTQEDAVLKLLIREVFWQHERRYGARRISQELISRGQPCGVVRVGRLLREMGLKAIQPKSYRPRTTDSRHRLGYSPNLLLDRLPPSGINQVWVGDISYVPLRGGDFLYLGMLMDLYSRRIVAWELQDHLKESLVLPSTRPRLRWNSPRRHSNNRPACGGRTCAGRCSTSIFSGRDLRSSPARVESSQSGPRPSPFSKVFPADCERR
jgi:putative transposase